MKYIFLAIYAIQAMTILLIAQYQHGFITEKQSNKATIAIFAVAFLMLLTVIANVAYIN